MEDRDDGRVVSLAEALPAEINRVRKLQDDFKSLRGMPNVIVEPQIMIMEAAIQSAIRACSAGTVIDMLRAYENLGNYILDIRL